MQSVMESSFLRPERRMLPDEPERGAQVATLAGPLSRRLHGVVSDGGNL